MPYRIFTVQFHSLTNCCRFAKKKKFATQFISVFVVCASQRRGKPNSFIRWLEILWIDNGCTLWYSIYVKSTTLFLSTDNAEDWMKKKNEMHPRNILGINSKRKQSSIQRFGNIFLLKQLFMNWTTFWINHLACITASNQCIPHGSIPRNLSWSILNLNYWWNSWKMAIKINFANSYPNTEPFAFCLFRKALV